MSENPVKWTFIFIAASVIGFILQQVTDEWVYLAFFPILALEAPWIFLTSLFLHADFSHLFFNMFALFFFGTYLERMIGSRPFTLLFLASGFLGNLGYLFTASNPMIPAIGASGAVYGLIGALATLTPSMTIFIYGLLPVPMIVAAILWGLLDFIGLFAPSGIAHGAHLAGMIAGVSYGFYLRMKIRRYLSHYTFT